MNMPVVFRELCLYTWEVVPTQVVSDSDNTKNVEPSPQGQISTQHIFKELLEC